MDIAAADLSVALQEAELACANPLAPTRQQHAANVVHALVPEAQPGGAGTGYGATRALMGTIEHLEFAATSADASLNLVTAVANLSVHGEAVHGRLEVATELAQSLLSSTTTEFHSHCERLLNELTVALHGGTIGSSTNAYSSIGFNALHDELLATLDRERDPSYAPVPRRYVLGLVRLPTGEWRYRLPKPQHSHIDRPTPYSYGY